MVYLGICLVIHWGLPGKPWFNHGEPWPTVFPKAWPNPGPTLAQPWPNLGATLAKPWHNLGVTMAKPWLNPGKPGVSMVKPWRTEFLKHGPTLAQPWQPTLAASLAVAWTRVQARQWPNLGSQPWPKGSIETSIEF